MQIQVASSVLVRQHREEEEESDTNTRTCKYTNTNAEMYKYKNLHSCRSKWLHLSQLDSTESRRRRAIYLQIHKYQCTNPHIHKYTNKQLQIQVDISVLARQHSEEDNEEESDANTNTCKYTNAGTHKQQCTNTQKHKHTNTHAQMQKYTNSCRWRSRWIHQSLERWYIQREEEEKDQHDKPTFTNTLTYKEIKQTQPYKSRT